MTSSSPLHPVHRLSFPFLPLYYPTCPGRELVASEWISLSGCSFLPKVLSSATLAKSSSRSEPQFVK
jgi:hypothetical protein